MRSRHPAAVGAALALALPFGGCGGDDSQDAAPTAKQTTDSSPGETLRAEGAARAAASAIEACFVDKMDYSECKSPAVLRQAGVVAGTGPSEVTVTEASATGYTLEAHSEPGGIFRIEKTADGEMKRTCSGPGCSGGSW